MYASTLFGVTSALKREEIRAHAGSVGKPFVNTTVEIVDDRNRPLPPGKQGLLRVRAAG